MANPFERKFKQFAASLDASSTADKVNQTATEAQAVYQDKPFSVEYRPLFAVARIGRTLAQVVTFTATAGIAAFVILQVAPPGQIGYLLAVPISLLFAFGVEQVKWRALAIAAKQVFKYRTLGVAGAVAVLGVGVSVFLALVGARELPDIVHPMPARITADATNTAALDASIARVQSDIDRLKNNPSWTAQNRTIPRLMRERAALTEKRAEAAQIAQDAAGAAHAEGIEQRAVTVQRMRTYCVAAAIAGEAIFLLCGLFILYYLFRQFSEGAGTQDAASAAVEDAAIIDHAGTRSANGNALRYTVNLSTAERLTKIVNDTGNAICEHCEKSYLRNHKKQKYCSEQCRVASWEQRTGATLKK